MGYSWPPLAILATFLAILGPFGHCCRFWQLLATFRLFLKKSHFRPFWPFLHFLATFGNFLVFLLHIFFFQNETHTVHIYLILHSYWPFCLPAEIAIRQAELQSGWMSISGAFCQGALGFTGNARTLRNWYLGGWRRWSG